MKMVDIENIIITSFEAGIVLTRVESVILTIAGLVAYAILSIYIVFRILIKLDGGVGGLRRSILKTLPVVVIGEDDHRNFVFKNGLECVVCLSEICDGETARILQCSHVFHVECIDEWFRSHSVCPLCRSAVDGNWDGAPTDHGTALVVNETPLTASAPSSSTAAEESSSTTVAEINGGGDGAVVIDIPPVVDEEEEREQVQKPQGALAETLIH